jgi:hypothetical protein
MSGRSLHLRDGKLITNRKTDRRQTAARPMAERLLEFNRNGLADVVGKEVRIAFLLPASLQPMVASGPHGVGITVFARGFVRINGHSAEQCFGLARNFLGSIARDRAAFTAFASIVCSLEPDRSYGRHLTVVSGSLVVSAGTPEPKVFEARLP